MIWILYNRFRFPFCNMFPSASSSSMLLQSGDACSIAADVAISIVDVNWRVDMGR